ncbi:PspC domain-containing protein [Furfurilactobacillus sp. WILCCON 0119]
MKKQLTKSNDRVLAGVFGGVAEYFNWDKALTRVIGSILILSSIGTGLVVYAIAALVMPDADDSQSNGPRQGHHQDETNTFDGEFTDPDQKR